MQSLPNVCDSVREKCFSTENYTDVGENKGILSRLNYFKEQIYIMLEHKLLIVFLNPTSDNLTYVLSNNALVVL